jgi:glycosyltransferase involved in cell wall biosynthesis
VNPLVSILVPAHNAEETIDAAVRSALAQTWPRKEVIVVDDGSRDRTVEIVERFGSKVRLVSTKNKGAASARNQAFRLCSGDYIQWLDADDLLAADKIERQIQSVQQSDSRRLLLSTSWAPFYYRNRFARFVQNSLCQDLSATDWLIRKLSENLHMQTGTWLTSRDLAEAAGPWDTRLLSDDDGEYFCRVLLASEGTRFTQGTGVFYRVTPSNRLSHIGQSDPKKDAMLLSMKLHIRYLRSLEDSERVSKACVTYLQNWYPTFYPERADIVGEMQNLAAQFGGHLEEPRLRWKFAWMKPVFGWRIAKRAQSELPHLKLSCIRCFDKAMYKLENHEIALQ